LKKNGRAILGITTILLIVVMVSGCTSSSNTTDPTKDIYLQQQNPPYTIGDESQISAWITSKNHKSYSNVTLMVTGLDSNGQSIGEKKAYVDYLDNNYQSTGFTVKFPNTVDHITIKVLNATPEK